MWKLFLLNMYKGMKKWMMTALLLMLITTVQAGTKGNDKMSADIRQLAAQHFDMTLQTATDLYVMDHPDRLAAAAARHQVVLEVCRKWTKFSQVSSHTLIRAHDWTFSELNNLENDYHVAQYF